MTTTRTRTDERVFPRAAARRGVALLLVVVTLATATVLTTSYLIARENAPEIGRAAQDRITADWSARSAASIVQAAMETNVDWRTPANAGMLLQNVSLMGADINVAVTNLEGGPVGEDDTQVLMTVSAIVGGVETVVQRVITERDTGTYEDALDPGLSEFGVFATNSLEIDNNSRIDVWRASPAARAGSTAKIGLGFKTAGGVDAANGAIKNGAKAFLNPGSSAGLDSILDSFQLETMELPVEMWATTSETPSELLGLPQANKNMFPIYHTGNGAISAGGYGVPVWVDRAEITLDEADGAYLFAANNSYGAGLGIEDSVVTIKGNVVVGVIDDLWIDDSVFKFEDDSTLTVYHVSSVTIDDSVIGPDPELIEKNNRKYGDMKEWADPRRVRIIQMNVDAYNPSNYIEIRNNTLIAGSVHAPTTPVRVLDDSAVAGRVSAGALMINDKSAVLVDPIFDNRMGLTEPSTSPLYDAKGQLIPGLREAMESTTGSEGFAAAKARLMAALPPQPVPDNSPVDGATRRYQDTVTIVRDWPVRARLQEANAEESLFETPANAAMAAALGTLVKDVTELVRNGKTKETTKKSASTADAMSATK